jgi:hypothetical protein
MRNQVRNSNQTVVITETQIVQPQQRNLPELVIFDESDDIEMSPRHDPTKISSTVDLAQSARNKQLQKIKITKMLDNIKRNQPVINNRRPHRESIGIT